MSRTIRLALATAALAAVAAPVAASADPIWLCTLSRGDEIARTEGLPYQVSIYSYRWVC